MHQHIYNIDVYVRLESSWHHDGPVNAAEAEAWVAQLLSRLTAAERYVLTQALQNIDGVSTAYSGCGFFEFMIKQLCVHLNVDRPKFLHAFDIDAPCREALLSNSSLGCIFGDLCSLFCAKVLKKAKVVQRRLAREVRHRVADGEALRVLYCVHVIDEVVSR